MVEAPGVLEFPNTERLDLVIAGLVDTEHNRCSVFYFLEAFMLVAVGLGC